MAKPTRSSAKSAKASSKAGSRSVTKSSARPAIKSSAKVGARSGSKPGAKAAPKPASKPVTKAASKATSKPAGKPVGKPVGKAPTKATGKPEAKGDGALKVVVKPGAKAGSKAVTAPAAPAPSSSTPASIAGTGANGSLPSDGSAGGAGLAGALKHKPKGITIVAPKPMRKAKPKKEVVMPSLGAPLLGPGGVKKWKPLIPSGPNARPSDLGSKIQPENKLKSPFAKRELDRYREILLRKRAELVGDVSNLEGEALNAQSGNLSNTPQHMAEQGTESFDQALSLDIAQVDRNLIREIDDALTRIDRGTFGVCQMTGKAISKERLEELPWTRYSIEAARERERRSFTLGAPPPLPST